MSAMFSWVLHTLWHERGQVGASAVGIALAMLLSLYLDAVFRGEADQIVQFIERAPAGIWVLQDGVSNLHMNRSTLSEQHIADVRGIDGVAHVRPVLYRDVLVGPKDTQRIAYLIGVPAGAPEIGPWQLAAGSALPAPGEIVIPQPMADAEGIGIGDGILVEGRLLTVAGLSRETFSMANPFLFAAEADARELLDRGDGANLLLVTPLPGVDRVALAERIQGELDNVHVLLREKLAGRDRELAMQMGGALIGLMAVIGLVVNLLIVSFSAFVFLSNRNRELAVSRALGARPWVLVASAMLLCLTLAALGCLLAGAIAPLTGLLLSHWVPQVAVHFSLATYLYTAAGTLLMSLLAALLPATRILRIDPALVFNE